MSRYSAISASPVAASALPAAFSLGRNIDFFLGAEDELKAGDGDAVGSSICGTGPKAGIRPGRLRPG